MLQSYATSPVIAMFQGYVDTSLSPIAGVYPLLTYAAYNCVLTHDSTGEFTLDCRPFWLDDQDVIIQIMIYDADHEMGYVPDNQIIFSAGTGTAAIITKNNVTGTPALADPPFWFNIVVLDATDGVSNIEGGPGNP